ncbi:MAG: hypothetical protein M3493_09875 [Actinomycetota bacterium]|nr:hypothetical protein [Actinomycetota bacterium]
MGSDDEGNPVSEQVAARRLVGVLRNTRAVQTQHGKRDPLGVVIDANLLLEGLRDRQLEVSWSIWSRGGRSRLYGKWLRKVSAYHVTAESDSDSAALNFWVPLPKKPGEYVVRLVLSDGDTALASKRSEAFG